MSHYSAYDEAREAARPFLPLTPPPEATLGLNTSALLESVDSKLNELTDERYHISRRICTLKRLRNSVALVHRLPPEMLIEIFLLVTEDKSQLEHEHKPVLDMTHVCAHWRTVALAASRLWTHIPFLPLDLAKLFLARSKNMCVKYWIYELPALSFERAKLRDRLPLQRLQSLRVSLLEPDDMEDFLDVLTEPAPNLTVLCLQPGDGPFPDPDNRLEDVTRDTLFADATPKIRTVELTSFNIHWTSGIFNNLTQLKLRDQDGRVPPPDVFLDVLERCPHLEQLMYCCSLLKLARRISEHPSARPRLVTLSRLRDLHLVYQPSNWMATLLASLDLTATHAHVHLATIVERGRDDLSLDMLPPDTSRLMPLPCIRSLDLTHDVEEFRLTLRPDLSESWSGSVGTVDVAVQGGRPDLLYLPYRTAFENLDVSRLEELTLEDQSCEFGTMPHADWSFCLHSTKNLRLLRLINMSPEALAVILSLLFTPATGGHDDGDVNCPQLSTLDLIGVYHNLETKRLLVACMRQASSRQIPLKTVKLVGIGWPPQLLKGLQWEGPVTYECM